MRIEPLQLMPVKASFVDTIGNQQQVETKSFGEFLSDSLKEVNTLKKQSEVANMKLAAGQVEDISEVVIAGEKASIAVQLTMQVRNKMVEAYQEIMRMQV
ncbi:MAG: flagellar hook-basal body complex protein FliE [Negativicutes bacterium]|jgi:flagellar hook-basal body complex protein FliE|nr:flagellar hook-basal body complex protein FliE [Negativicutes bacterium]MBP8629374.1 flagellar hook-basal body complex protein FliE [Negativicutes bacterium]MBP9537915.1 flagellar hook-basal body complex protein FliE [Negativicutes bacterium]MBP9949455.1 flagellar hook-basal body complex protein FliE [Negativicutes bacterium]